MKLSQKSPEALSTLCSWSALFSKHVYCISSYSVSPLQVSPPSDSQHFFPHDSFNVSSTIGSKLSLSFLYQAGAVVKYNKPTVVYIQRPSLGIACGVKAFFSPLVQITVTEEPDTLFQKLVVLVKGHDRAVLDSYEFFATMTAKELGISLGKVWVLAATH